MIKAGDGKPQRKVDLMGRARILIDVELLKGVLHLPPDCRLEGDSSYVEFVVEHPDLKEQKPGEELPTANPTWTRQESVRFDGWGQ